MANKHVAVVGGGINGICIAWKFAEAGFCVDLLESGKLMGQTSSASSKLLHGGLRYLQYGRIWSVREALSERAWWLENAPRLTKRLPLLLPVYQGSPRSRYALGIGLTLYDCLAGRNGIGWHSWLSLTEVVGQKLALKTDGLKGAYLFYDGQMEDRELGLWAAERAREAGVRIRENTEVRVISPCGDVELLTGEQETYAVVINATGPWASQLVERSGINTQYGVECVRGSHVIVEGAPPCGFCLQHPDDGRVFFVLPYGGRCLIGTTEVEQKIEDAIAPSINEVYYLLRGFNHVFERQLNEEDVAEAFAGVRPLVKSHAHPTQAGREYRIERVDRLVNVWGGKWTTSRSLARKVCRQTSALISQG